MIFNDELYHYGVKGMKWGVRKDRSSGKRVFVSGSSKTQTNDPENPFYRPNLDKRITDELDARIKKGDRFLVGEAPGIDRQVQDYLKSKDYKRVTVYSSGNEARYLADPKWRQKHINAEKYEKGSKEWLAEKDKAMSRDATEGIAVTIEGGAKATRKNVERLLNDNKNVRVFEIRKDKSLDTWFDDDCELLEIYLMDI